MGRAAWPTSTNRWISRATPTSCSTPPTASCTTCAKASTSGMAWRPSPGSWIGLTEGLSDQMTSDLAIAPVDELHGNDGNRGCVYYGDNLPILRNMAPQSIDLIYTDPPFNTGRTQSRVQLRTIRDPNGDRTGFQGRRYRSIKVASRAFNDDFDDYLAFLEPRLEEAHRVLTKPRDRYIFISTTERFTMRKFLLDGIFGRNCFLNEVIWAYDYGGSNKARNGRPKHDNILVYARDPEQVFLQR